MAAQSRELIADNLAPANLPQADNISWHRRLAPDSCLLKIMPFNRINQRNLLNLYCLRLCNKYS
jgi:hypothetical protein